MMMEPEPRRSARVRVRATAEETLLVTAAGPRRIASW